MTGPRRPPSRLVSLLGVLAVALLLIGLLQVANLMRHPMPDDMPPVPELDADAADPRTEIDCPDPPQEAADDETRAATPPLMTSNELLDCPRSWDGQTIRYRGEAVGAVLQRADGAWVQLNDDIYAQTRGPLPTHRDYAGGNAGLGAFIPLELAERIGRVGGPRFRGDVLEIEGQFRRVDGERREAAVIVAHTGIVAGEGRPIEDPVLPERRVIALVLVLLAAATVTGERLVAARR